MELPKPKKSFSKQAEECIRSSKRFGDTFSHTFEDLLLMWGHMMDDLVEEWRQALQGDLRE